MKLERCIKARASRKSKARKDASRVVMEVVERLSKRGRNCCRNEDCVDRLDRLRASNLSNTAAVQFEAAWEATVTKFGRFESIRDGLLTPRV